MCISRKSTTCTMCINVCNIEREKNMKVTESIIYVGVDDKEMDLFESQ